MRVRYIVSSAAMAIFFSNTHAQTLPIDLVIPAASSCLSDYQTRYMPLPKHRAFAFALNHQTGRQRCGWVYGVESEERAREVAVAQCASKPIDATCHVVDLDGQWVAQAKDFTPIEQPDSTPLTETKKRAMLDSARRLVLGNCHPFLGKYFDGAGYKAFAYSVDEAGRYACGQAAGQITPASSMAKAIAACDRNKAKRGKQAPHTPCVTYAAGNEILLGAQSYGLNALPPAPRHLSDQEYKAYVTEADTVLLQSCHFSFKSYIRGNGHKAFFYAMDVAGKYACGHAVGAFTETQARQTGLAKCQQSSAKKKLSSPCKLYASNNEIVGTASDFPLASGVEGFKVALSKGMLPRVRNYLGQGMDIETASVKEGATALLVAAMKGDLDAYRSFLAAGANPRHRLNDGSNLVLTAVAGGNVTIVRDAMDRGIDLNEKGVQGNTPLVAALKKLDTYTAQLLVAAGADATIKNDKGESAETILKNLKVNMDYLKKEYNAMEAAKNNDLIGLQDIVSGLDATARREQLSPPLWVMTRLSEETFRYLLKHGADANLVNSYGETVLMSAASLGKQQLIEILLAHGADKAARDENGKQAVDFAKDEQLKALLK